MGLTKRVLSICGVLMSVSMVSADDLLRAEDFYERVAVGDEVWGIVFGIEPGDDLATLKTLREKTTWLSVGWMNVADADSRLIADVHGITSYPAIRIFNGRVEKPDFPSAAIFDAAVTRPVISPKGDQLTVKEAVKKWLPSRLPSLDGRLASVLPIDEDDVTCRVSLQENDISKIATARAVAIKFWNTISMSLVYSDTEGIQCTGDQGDVDINFDNFTFDEVVKSLTDANIAREVDEEAALTLRREAALKESQEIQSIMQLKHSAVFDDVMSSQGIEILFVLNSDSAEFDSHMTSADEIQNAKTKTGQQARFRYLWLDIKTEGKKILQDMGLRPSHLPAILFYLPVKTQEGQIAKAQMLYDGPFAASDVAKFIDNEMMKGVGLVPVNPAAFKKLSGDLEDKQASTTQQADDEEDLLELEESSKKGSKKPTKPKKGGKKKERKLTKKEQEKEDKIKEEVAAKKAAREKRVREKKEKEEAEKEAKRQEKKDKKKKAGSKKKTSTDKSESDGKKKTKATKGKKETSTKNKKDPKKDKAEKKAEADAKAKSDQEDETIRKMAEMLKKQQEGEKQKDDENMTPEEREKMMKDNKAQLDDIIKKMKKEQEKKEREERKKEREESRKRKEAERVEERKAKKEAREKQKKLEKEWADEDGEDIAIRDEL